MASNYDARSEDEQPNKMLPQQGTSMKPQPVRIARGGRRIDFNEEAFERVLNQPGVDNKPIVLVSIMGDEQTGKSTMLNLFLRYLSNEAWKNKSWLYDRKPDFGVGFNQISNIWSGMWLWSEAFIVNSHGREVAIFLMETREITWEMTSVLSTLLSSVQIFNVKQQIDASDLESIEYNAQWTTRIGEKNETGNPSRDLMFLVRDWGFPERYGFGQRGGNQYLEEEILRERRGRSMKKTLDDSFNTTSCFLMPHPGPEISHGGMSIHTVAVEGMDKDFLCQVGSLAETILHPSNLKVKFIDGEEVDASMMIKLAKSCREAFLTKIPLWQRLFGKKHRTSSESQSKSKEKRVDGKEESARKGTEMQKRSDKQRDLTGSSSLHGEPLRSTGNLSRPEAVRILGVVGDRLDFDEEAFSQVLGQPGIDGKPIVLVSIAGALRSGKSFMLNFFLRYLRNKGWKNNTWMGDMDSKLVDGFRWRPGLDPDTHGITIWSEIFVVKSNDREVAVLLMDTQGLYDRAISKTLSTQIFVLSTLLSSVQIFNVSQQIRESDLQDIQLFAEYGREATGIEDRRLCQKLMFLVRDWQDPRNMDFGLDGGTEYLKHKLEVARAETSLQLLQVREKIQNSFDSIVCFLMPFPGMKVAGFSKAELYDGILEEIDEEFIQQLTPLIESILHPNNMTVKRIEGQEADARTIVKIAKSCSDSFASGQLPEVKTVVEATEDFLNVEAYQTCIKEYDEKMQQVLKSAGDQTDEEYRNEHDQTKLRVLAQFDDQTGFGSQTKMKAKREELESALEKAFANLHLASQEPNKGWIVSKTLSASIDIEGGCLEISDNRVVFQPWTFNEATDIEACVEIDSSKWPKGYIGIAPVLYVKAENKLLKPATVHMTSWCTSDGSSEGHKTKVIALHRIDGSDTWDEICRLPLGRNTSFQFDCLDFSPIFLGIRERFFGPQNFLVDGFLFASKQNRFTLEFCLKNAVSRKILLEEMTSRGYALEVDTDTLVTKRNDEIHATITPPDGFFLRPAGEYEFRITRDFIASKKKASFDCLVKSETVNQTDLFEFTLDVKKNDESVDGKRIFNYVWRAKSQIVKQACATEQGAAALVVHGNVATQTLAIGVSQVTVSTQENQSVVSPTTANPPQADRE